MDPEGGKQPIVYEDVKYSLVQTVKYTNSAAPGIYPYSLHFQLCALFYSYDLLYPCRRYIYFTRKNINLVLQRLVLTQVLLQLYRCKGPEFAKELNGIFGFVCVGDDGDKILAARDHCGIKPLYMGYGKNGSIWFTRTEGNMYQQTIEEFPAGYYWTPFSGFVTL